MFLQNISFVSAFGEPEEGRPRRVQASFDFVGTRLNRRSGIKLDMDWVLLLLQCIPRMLLSGYSDERQSHREPCLRMVTFPLAVRVPAIAPDVGWLTAVSNWLISDPPQACPG